MSLTDPQQILLGDLDDVAQHVGVEFEPDDWTGISTCGMAHIHIPDGRTSFVRVMKALAESDDTPNVTMDRRGDVQVTDLGVDLSMREDSYRGGYRLSITNIQDMAIGASWQRLDVQEWLHRLVLNRLQYNGWLGDAGVRSRVD